MNQQPPATEEARSHFEFLVDSDQSSTRQLGLLGLLAINCQADKRTARPAVTAAFTEQPEAIEADLLRAFEFLGTVVMSSPCDGLSPEQMGKGLSAFLDRHPPGSLIHQHWRLRFLAAKLFHSAHDTQRTREQLEIAWHSPAAEAPVGAMLTATLINLGAHDEAKRTLSQTESRLGRYDSIGLQILDDYRKALDTRAAGNPAERLSP